MLWGNGRVRGGGGQWVLVASRCKRGPQHGRPLLPGAPWRAAGGLPGYRPPSLRAQRCLPPSQKVATHSVKGRLCTCGLLGLRGPLSGWGEWSWARARWDPTGLLHGTGARSPTRALVFSPFDSTASPGTRRVLTCSRNPSRWEKEGQGSRVTSMALVAGSPTASSSPGTPSCAKK